ncbi:MAG TPA: hypothetical protein HPP97_07075 [Desulfuromonadales bacterium]|nr:hypothetical protein [Desulfuromonadales bacterium]
MNTTPVNFENIDIRRVYDEKTETWYFSVVDIIRALLQQPDFQAARNYWKVLKNRLSKEGSESVTKCNRLKLEAADGKKYLTDVASPEVLLRLIQSVPSRKAEPIKIWLAKVGYERMQDMADPSRSLDRAREYWQQHGRSEKWIQQRMTGQETRNKLTDYTILVFARGQKKQNGVTVPFTYLGPVERISYESERPIKMVWRLRYPMSVEMFEDNRRGG